MASSLCVLLSLVLATAVAAPVEDAETTTAANEVGPLVSVIEVIEAVPVLVPLVEDAPEATTEVEAKEPKVPEHKVERRSLRGDNPSNDLLAELEGQQYDRGLTSFAGRRIKFLPTFLG